MQDGRWTTRACDWERVDALARALEVSDTTATVLVRRGLGDPDEARAFLAAEPPGHDPFLLGDMAAHRTLELELKGQVMKPMEVLLSATRVNAELLRLDHRIGTVEPGKEADLIAVAGNPLEDLRLFQDPERLHLVMKGGAVYRQRL